MQVSGKRSRPAEPLVRSQTGVTSCRRCRSRKIKCDDGFPRCDGCTKADVLCIVVDPSMTRDHTRAEVQSLEEELLQLQALLESSSTSENGVNFNEPVARGQSTARTLRTGNGNQPALPTANSDRGQPPAPPQRRICFEGFDKPHALPSYAYAVQAMAEYSREFHVCHPILDQEAMTVALRSVYKETGVVCTPERPHSRAQKRDLFQLNMVLAIGSIKLFHERPGSLHPFGFFTAALEVSPPSEFHFNDVSDVSNILLIAYFGLFYNIGCSIWELGRFCVRICIELQLHRPQSTLIPAGVATQRCKQVFWESYLLDRFSSTTLGRPFAVEDEAIGIDVPNDSVTKTFNHLIRIGRIKSHMHLSIYYPNPQTIGRYDGLSPDRPTNTLSHLRKFHAQLHRWKLEAPACESPACVYETGEFFEMMYQESRLWLFRTVMHKLPESQPEMKRRLSLLCYQAAQQVLACFNNIRGENLFSYNRSLARLILISGLTIISTIKLESSHAPKQSEEHCLSDIDLDFWLKDIAPQSATSPLDSVASSEALNVCQQSLSWLASSIPEVSAYVQLFSRLRSETGVLLRPDLVQGECGSRALAIGASTAAASAAGTSQHQQTDWSHGYRQAADMLQGLDPYTSAISTTSMAISDPAMVNQTVELDTEGNFGFEVIEQNFPWSFSHEPWMEGIDGDISGMIWDTALPWQWSPSINL